MTGPEGAPTSVDELLAVVHTAMRDPAGAMDPLRRVCRACAELLPVDGASISVMTGTTQRETLYASDTVIGRIEALQFSLGEGPCFEAFETRRPVLVPDLAAATTESWPVFAAEMIDQPVGAIFAFPLLHGAARFGALDMYRRTPGWLSADELTTALQVIDIATTALVGTSLALSEDRFIDAWLADVPGHRDVVHIAAGMLIAEHRIPAEQALARLRGHAFAAGRLVDEVAADLVARRLHPADIET